MEHRGTGTVEQGIEALTEKEKQTLRLLLVGHDAKSMARHFGLSVHTVNERLRDARRKLAVSSSKEAARRLHEAERAVPQNPGDAAFGDAPPAIHGQSLAQPAAPSPFRRRRWVIGGLAMTLLLAALLAVPVPAPTPAPSQAADRPTASPASETAASAAARAWLGLVDQAAWPESWAATGTAFRSLNSIAAWRAASERARAPLGRVLSRTLVGDEDVPAPPRGYRLVRFHTDFANKVGAIETVSLEQEGQAWKVVGITIG